MTYTLEAFVKDAQAALGADNSPAGREKVRQLLEKLLPNEQYAKVQPIKDAKAWEETSKALPSLWQENVIINME